MSALEVSVQPYLTPLLTGQRVELSREALRLIAKWTYKTAMVFDVINPVNGLRYFTDDELNARATARSAAHVACRLRG